MIIILRLLPKRTSPATKNLILSPNDKIKTMFSNREIVCWPKEQTPKIGIIFYTGAQVEHFAYADIFVKLAENGVLIVAKDAPLHYANFATDDIDDIFKRFPEIKTWYFMGHSLGAQVALKQAFTYKDKVKGVIQIGGHPKIDISQIDLQLLNIYASHDKIANPEFYPKFNNNLPKVHQYSIIDGGIHTYFGDYKANGFDGKPSISKESQVAQTVKIILNFINA